MYSDRRGEPECRAARLFAGSGRNGVPSDNCLESIERRVSGDANDQAGTNPEVLDGGARHARRRLPGCQTEVTEGLPFGGVPVCEPTGRECSRRQRFRIDRLNTGPDDAQSVLTQLCVRGGQWLCFGSDQAERPVTTSNFLRRELTS